MKIIREHFPIEYRKPKTKVITVASQINWKRKILASQKADQKERKKNSLNRGEKARERNAGYQVALGF